MHILVSNDDGYHAPGLIELEKVISKIAQTTVVAPDRNCSGASNSLTLMRPLRVNQSENGFYHVDGTPTDCVHLALTGLLAVEPDMVVSGINAGSNLGDDTLYSGTVAAATEGRYLGLPALAISLVGKKHQHYDTAARAAQIIIEQLKNDPLAEDTILNINVPDIPWAEIQGLEATRLGFRHKSEPTVKQFDPYGNPVYWIGPVGPSQDAGPGTDFYAVEHNIISITPLQIDLTRHHGVKPLQNWLQKLAVN